MGVVGFEIIKRLFANTSVEDAENTMGIAVLANASIRAAAVRALAITYWEMKKGEFILRDMEPHFVEGMWNALTGLPGPDAADVAARQANPLAPASGGLLA